MIPTPEQILSAAGSEDSDPDIVDLAEFIAADPMAVRIRALFAVFDAVAAVRADLSVFERSEPHAPIALRGWAASRGRSVLTRDGHTGMRWLEVRLPGEHTINVYLQT